MSRRNFYDGHYFAIVCLFAASGLAAEVGDSCTIGSISGICQVGSKCTTLEPLFKQGILKGDNIAHCGYTTHEEIICCPTTGRSGEISPTPTKPSPTQFTFQQSTTTVANRNFSSNHLTTTSTPKTDFWSNLVTTTASTANRDFWLELLSTSTTTPTPSTSSITTLPSTTIPSSSKITNSILPPNAEFYDFDKVLNSDSRSFVLNTEVSSSKRNQQLTSSSLPSKFQTPNMESMNCTFTSNIPCGNNLLVIEKKNSNGMVDQMTSSSDIINDARSIKQIGNNFHNFPNKIDTIDSSSNFQPVSYSHLNEPNSQSNGIQPLNSGLNLISNINNIEMEWPVVDRVWYNFNDPAHTSQVSPLKSIPRHELTLWTDFPNNQLPNNKMPGLNNIESELSSFELIWERDEKQKNQNFTSTTTTHNGLSAIPTFQFLYKKSAAYIADNSASDGCGSGKCPENVRPGTTTKATPITPINERPAVRACRQIEKDLSPALTYHIIDGVPAELGEFPHMVAIGFKSIVDEKLPVNFLCGGTLIDKRFVLTAAHCVNRRDVKPVIARMGVVDFNEPVQMQNVVERNITQSYIHNNYSLSSVYNDIALLELDRDVVFTREVRPTCLYTINDDLPPNAELFVTGWGTTNITTRTISDKLLKAKLSSTTSMECNQTYFEESGKIFDRKLSRGFDGTQLCAVDVNATKDACQGDSGGPLNLVVDLSSYQYRVAGIISTGFSCGSHVPGLYTRVAAYLDYIESIVWPTEK